MNSLKVFGKYLDQPKLVEKFSQAAPAVLVLGGGAYGFNHVQKIPENEKKKETIKTVSVLTTTILSAIMAPTLTSKIVKGHCCHHHHHEHDVCEHAASQFIDNFIKENPKLKVIPLLEKAKKTHLSINEVGDVFDEVGKTNEGKKFLKKLIPDPEDIDSNHIFKEDVKRLSVLGIFPVLGGITGGIIGDKLTEKNWKDRIPNKIKEGSYQYLANIFLCNVGAGVALWILEKCNCKNKAARVIGMVSGIAIAGLVFGSAIANLIGKTCIDPFFHSKEKNYNHRHEDLYSERRPEVLDMGLHIDDVATVAVLSGLKWIEPALPILYSISGYRAGIGYRNGEDSKSEYVKE